jgi:hypothetical protein
MSTALDLALKLADEIQQFPLGRCGPSDDLDMQYAYTAGFRDLAVRLVGAIKRIGDPDLSNAVSVLNLAPSFISEAHDLRSELFVIIDQLNELAQDPTYATQGAANSVFLDSDILLKLKSTRCDGLDPSKLIKMCEELNDAYARGNYITSLLLMRAIMNHVPPAFEARTFAEVVAKSGRSIKAILSRLDDEARPIADLHTHILMRPSEHLPTKHQIEPYKAGFEILIQEILTRLSPNAV